MKLKDLQKYNKAIVAGIAVVLTGLNALYGQDWRVQLVVSVATALGVFGIANKK
jgi:hypothetical protein